MKEGSGNNKHRQKNSWETRFDFSSRRNPVWFGIFLLLIGVAGIINITVPGLPGWLFSWKTLLIALGCLIGIRRQFRGGSWLLLILIGGAFLITDIYPELAIKRFIWPTVWILLGLFFIFRPGRIYIKKFFKDDRPFSDQ